MHFSSDFESVSSSADVNFSKMDITKGLFILLVLLETPAMEDSKEKTLDPSTTGDKVPLADFGRTWPNLSIASGVNRAK